ncbi:HAD family hydrolase [Streptomyces sp. NPDC001393]
MTGTRTSAGSGAGTGTLSRARGIAFFDVDETLITAKSMLAFWDHWVASGAAERHGTAAVPDGGPDRAARNRAHFRRYAGVPLAELRAAARQWYEGYRTGPTAFVGATVEALRRHRAAGDAVVLVSGSARPMLEPIARDLGTDEVLSTELLVTEGGLLTGEVRRPMVGAAKGEAVAGLLERYGLPAERAYGYGDHASDLSMLQAVGRPHVVGDDPELAAHAAHRGWPRVPASGGPR